MLQRDWGNIVATHIHQLDCLFGLHHPGWMALNIERVCVPQSKDHLILIRQAVPLRVETISIQPRPL
jgi:hypothetical protein